MKDGGEKLGGPGILGPPKFQNWVGLPPLPLPINDAYVYNPVCIVSEWETFTPWQLLFLSYVFQLVALMLELTDQLIIESYIAIFPLILSPMLWERIDNVPALSRLKQAFIQKVSTVQLL